MVGYFVNLLMRPDETTNRILRKPPSFVRIILFLTIIGLLQWLTHTIGHDVGAMAIAPDGTLWLGTVLGDGVFSYDGQEWAT